jgi:hypothetical protein
MDKVSKETAQRPEATGALCAAFDVRALNSAASVGPHGLGRDRESDRSRGVEVDRVDGERE